LQANSAGLTHTFAIIGGGSWATALAKILTDNGHHIHWWIRNTATIDYMRQRGHNPHYLSSVNFDKTRFSLYPEIGQAIAKANTLIVGVPSAYIRESFAALKPEDLAGKKIVSAIKGLIPGEDILLNEYLEREFDVQLSDYFAVLGPCHAEEVAGEKLSYLTFSGVDLATTRLLAAQFSTPYINTVVNGDILGVQYAAVLKNIYALGAGIARGLEYGDNFLSVFIANCADEMAGFLKKFGAEHIVVGEHEEEDPVTHRKSSNYAASVYLGDLLVTCYSLFSRNRTFGQMIGKGYSVQAAQLEMNMVAEGYHAAKCIYNINRKVGAEMPIAETVYQIVWNQVKPSEGFRQIEQSLI
jgi:glycerol-3-phosphate dehydrogenase (NAD(P)+)